MRIFWVGILAFWGGVAALAAQPIHGQIQGQVKWGGKPLAGVEMTLVDTTEGSHKKTYTDAGGHYAFGFLKPQHIYHLWCHYPGLDTLKKAFFGISAGQTIFQQWAWDPKGKSPLVLLLDPVRAGQPKNSMGTVQLTSTALSNLALMPDPWRGMGQLLPSALPRDRLNGLSFLGQHPRYNAVYIDGVLINDFTGLSPTGTYGGLVGSLPFSVALAEKLEWQLSPYDPAYAGFSGASLQFFNPLPTGKPMFRARVDQSTGPLHQQQWAFQGRSAWRPRWWASWRWVLSSSALQVQPHAGFYQGQLNLSQQAEVVANSLQDRWGWNPGPLHYFQNKEAKELQLSLHHPMPKNRHLVFRLQANLAWRKQSGSMMPQHLVFEQFALHQRQTFFSAQAEWHQARRRYRTDWFQASFQLDHGRQDPVGGLLPQVEIWDSTHWWLLGSPEQAIDNRSYKKQVGLRYMGTQARANSFHSWGASVQVNAWNNHYLPQLQGSFTYFSVIDFLRHRPPSAYGLRFGKDFTVQAPPVHLLQPQMALHYQWQKKWFPQWTLFLGGRAEWQHLGPGPNTSAAFEQDFTVVQTAYPMSQSPFAARGLPRIGLSPRVQWKWQSPNGRWRLEAGMGRFQGQMPLVWRAGAWLHNGERARSWQADPPSLRQLRLAPIGTDPRPLALLNQAALSMVQWQDPNLRQPFQWRYSFLGEHQHRRWRWTVEAHGFQHQQAWRVRNLLLRPAQEQNLGPDRRWLYLQGDSLNLFTAQGKPLPYEALLYLDNRPRQGGWGWQVQTSLFWRFKKMEWQGQILLGESYSFQDGQGSFLLHTWTFQTAAQGRNQLALSRSDYSPGYQWQIMGQGKWKWKAQQEALQWQVQWQAFAGQPYSFVYGKQSLVRDLPQTGGYDLMYIPLAEEIAQMNFLPLIKENVYYSPQWQASALEKVIQSHPYLSANRGKTSARNGARLPTQHRLGCGFQQNWTNHKKPRKHWISLRIQFWAEFSVQAPYPVPVTGERLALLNLVGWSGKLPQFQYNLPGNNSFSRAPQQIPGYKWWGGSASLTYTVE